MGMRVSLAFFFSFAFEGQGEKNQRNSKKCLAELTENGWRVDRTFLFFWMSEPGTGARPSARELTDGDLKGSLTSVN